MRLKRYLTALLAAAALLAQSCIKNDIPYPEVEINITGVEGRGFTVASIDVTTRTVTSRSRSRPTWAPSKSTR